MVSREPPVRDQRQVVLQLQPFSKQHLTTLACKSKPSRSHARKLCVSDADASGEIEIRASCRRPIDKLIAAELGISVRTVERHRASIMEKLRVRTLSKLIRTAVERNA
ncbi:MAG: hypothetical protein JO188_01525 [Hyphomicrobiales bacterium]|nr:hypothetical protein [Hyphomicrobiales bacterium]